MSLSGYNSRLQSAMNADLLASEQGSRISSAERKALKQMKMAEQSFREIKGYPPDTFFSRMKARFTKNKKK